MSNIIHTAIAPRYEEETKHKQSTGINGTTPVSVNAGNAKYNDPLLSREELAERWGLCIETLKRWEKSGKLSFLKIGKQVRYRLSVIQDIEYGSEVLS